MDGRARYRNKAVFSNFFQEVLTELKCLSYPVLDHHHQNKLQCAKKNKLFSTFKNYNSKL